MHQLQQILILNSSLQNPNAVATRDEQYRDFQVSVILVPVTFKYGDFVTKVTANEQKFSTAYKWNKTESTNILSNLNILLSMLFCRNTTTGSKEIIDKLENLLKYKKNILVGKDIWQVTLLTCKWSFIPYGFD